MSHSETDAPISHFSHCHVGILSQLSRLNELPALLGPAALARKTAEQSIAFFGKGMYAHHKEEEQELFPAVRASAHAGPERLRVEIARVRAQGHALVDQELELGLRTLSVPLRNYRGEVVAAMNLSVHAARMRPDELLDRGLPVLLQAQALLKPLL